MRKQTQIFFPNFVNEMIDSLHLACGDLYIWYIQRDQWRSYMAWDEFVSEGVDFCHQEGILIKYINHRIQNYGCKKLKTRFISIHPLQDEEIRKMIIKECFKIINKNRQSERILSS